MVPLEYCSLVVFLLHEYLKALQPQHSIDGEQDFKTWQQGRLAIACSELAQSSYNK